MIRVPRPKYMIGSIVWRVAIPEMSNLLVRESAHFELIMDRVTAQLGGILIILLCGGDKKTQDRDIKKAKVLAKELRGQKL
jgi:putative addiction module killer protein